MSTDQQLSPQSAPTSPPVLPNGEVGSIARPALTTPSTSAGRLVASSRPDEVIADSAPTVQSPSGRGSLKTPAIAVASFLLGATVALGAYALGANDGETAAPPVGAAVSPTSNESEASSGSNIALDGTSTERVAMVAAVVGPSVVEVETPFGQGSGVVYDEGLIITNSHVVNGARDIRILNSQGQDFPVELVGEDVRNDVAVLRVVGSDERSAGQNINDVLPVASLGRSNELVPGQTTVAIGSPFALSQTVTAGIVSSTNRPVPNLANSYSAMIQTDAPINPGNSGGALANQAGEVIGINASIRTDGRSNSNVGIGFAIPIDTAVRVAERIVNGETLEPGVLGITGAGEDGDVGVPVATVVPGSSAASAGLRPDDRILTIEGAPVTNIEELVGLVQANYAGDTVSLQVRRGPDSLTVQATLG